jgi:phosphoribulokinase
MPETNFKDVIAGSPYVFTIGVAGDSGSGKTTFTGSIREIFGKELVSTITLDDYHLLDRRERKKAGITPLAPEANNIALLEEHLAALRAGRVIQKPVYNHRSGRIEGPVSFAPTKIIILEGLHTLFTPGLRNLLDFSLFVDPAEEVKECWKVRRDMERRGYRRSEVLAEIEERRPDYLRYIAPQKEKAEAIVSIGFSRYGKGCGPENNIYSVTLCQDRLDRSIGEVGLSIDLFSILSLSDRNFLLEFRKHDIGGRRMGALTFDGELQYDVIRKLERSVEEQTGVQPISIFRGQHYVTATDIIQLILSWRIIHRRLFIEYGRDEDG